MARTKLGVRAFVVSDPDHDESDWVYAETSGQARAAAELDFCDFIRREVRRAPELDQYLDKGGPTKADLLKHHWWFTCHHHGVEPEQTCFDRVDHTSGAADGDAVYCWKHLAAVKGIAYGSTILAVADMLMLMGANPTPAAGVAVNDALGWDMEKEERIAPRIKENFGVTIPEEMVPELSAFTVETLAAYISLLKAGEVTLDASLSSLESLHRYGC